MIRLSKLTDYAVVLLTTMATEDKDFLHTASFTSQKTNLPEPTVAKLLKLLNKADILRSVRGAGGGYAMKRSLDKISMADLIRAIEGPIALTACVENHQGTVCSAEGLCPMKGGWDQLNGEIIAVMERFPISRMVQFDNKKEAIL